MQRWIVICSLVCVTLPSFVVAAQTVVELDLASCRKLLSSSGMEDAYPMLEKLANNYRKYDNVRVHSHRYEHSLAVVARALRTDFDGSGSGYVPEANIWRLTGSTGNLVFLAASMMDPGSVLLARKLENMLGMVAYELLTMLKQERLSIEGAMRKARLWGIEMTIVRTDDGTMSVSFFGSGSSEGLTGGRLFVVEPPDLVWN